MASSQHSRVLVEHPQEVAGVSYESLTDVTRLTLDSSIEPQPVKSTKVRRKRKIKKRDADGQTISSQETPGAAIKRTISEVCSYQK